MSLENFRFHDIPDFSLNGQCVDAKVVQVYDGDTFRAIVKLEWGFVKVKCRVGGIDAPEIKPPLSCPNRADVITSAKKARDRLCQILTGEDEWSAVCDNHCKIVKLHCGKWDKYGRLLVHEPEIADVLLSENLCQKKY